MGADGPPDDPAFLFRRDRRGKRHAACTLCTEQGYRLRVLRRGLQVTSLESMILAARQKSVDDSIIKHILLIIREKKQSKPINCKRGRYRVTARITLTACGLSSPPILIFAINGGCSPSHFLPFLFSYSSRLFPPSSELCSRALGALSSRVGLALRLPSCLPPFFTTTPPFGPCRGPRRCQPLVVLRHLKLPVVH